MEGSSVKRQPMSQGIEEPNNQGDSHHEKDEE